MMLATNPKAMVFFHDTKLEIEHFDLSHVQKGNSIVINSTCDPELTIGGLFSLTLRVCDRRFGATLRHYQVKK